MANETGATHPPIADQQRNADERRRENRTPELRDGMGKGVFKACAVAHDRTGQVGKIPFMEEAQRQRPQLFHQRNAAALAFFVGSHVGHGVLPVVQNENQRQNDDPNDGV